MSQPPPLSSRLYQAHPDRGTDGDEKEEGGEDDDDAVVPVDYARHPLIVAMRRRVGKILLYPSASRELHPHPKSRFAESMSPNLPNISFNKLLWGY